MPNVLELFNTKTMLNYITQRQYQEYAIGESLFPEQKYQTLDFEYLVGANALPVVAKAHAFDTEAEIGSVEAAKQALEAAYIKKKYQITEKMLIALNSPRDAAEQQYLTQQVFNLTDKAVIDVRSRAELMRMQAVSSGTVTLDLYNGTTVASSITIDYGVPASHKETLAGNARWSEATADILGDIQRWTEALPSIPTRVLTSRKIAGLILKNTAIKNALYGAGSGRVANLADLNAFLVGQGLPTITVYNQGPNSQYRVQNANGTYTTQSYFPDDKFVLLPEGQLGETLYGPTPEENRMIRDGAIVGNQNKVITMLYEEGQDPISTWTKAAATIIPSFPMANDIFIAKPID